MASLKELLKQLHNIDRSMKTLAEHRTALHLKIDDVLFSSAPQGARHLETIIDDSRLTVKKKTISKVDTDKVNTLGDLFEAMGADRGMVPFKPVFKLDAKKMEQLEQFKAFAERNSAPADAIKWQNIIDYALDCITTKDGKSEVKLDVSPAKYGDQLDGSFVCVRAGIKERFEIKGEQ